MLELSPGCARWLGIRPVSGPELAARVLVLGTLQPIDVGDHPRAVAFRDRRRRKPWSAMQIAYVLLSCCGPSPAQKRQCLLD